MQVFEHWGYWCLWIYFVNRNKSFIRYHSSSNSGGELEIVTVIKKGGRVARKYTSQISEEVGERGRSIWEQVFLTGLLVHLENFSYTYVAMWSELSWVEESWGKNLARGTCAEMEGYSENELLCSAKKLLWTEIRIRLPVVTDLF